MPHRDGSDGVPCAHWHGCRRQVSGSASGLSDRSVGDMTHGLGLCAGALLPPSREEKPITRKALGFECGRGRYGDGSAECCGVVMGVGIALSEVEGEWVRGEWEILPWH